jgi:TPR repeat protein
MYHLALGVEYDGCEAIKWYEKAAEQGYGVASNNLAEIYRAGQCGVTADLKVAEKWYYKAVEQGFIHTRKDFFEVST